MLSIFLRQVFQGKLTMFGLKTGRNAVLFFAASFSRKIDNVRVKCRTKCCPFFCGKFFKEKFTIFGLNTGRNAVHFFAASFSRKNSQSSG